MFVKPREGMRVLDPVSRRPLPPTGANMPDNAYWRRHIARGDAEEVKVLDAAPPAAEGPNLVEAAPAAPPADAASKAEA